MLQGFHHRKNPTYTSKDVEDQKQATQATPEASTIETIKVSEISNHVDTASEDNVSDFADFSANENIHHYIHDMGFFPTKNIFPNLICNEILSHYNCILIGCFKDIFQSVDTNNLAAVLQALKELNFVLANRAPELSAHYGMPLEPHQVSAEEVPDFVNAYLNRPAAYKIKHNSRGRPKAGGVQHNRYTRQSSPVPRYNQQLCR